MGIKWHALKTAEQKEQERLDSLCAQCRTERDRKMLDVVNWYQRYERETRLGLPHTLSIEQIDQYATALADIPEQAGFPEQVVWPEHPAP
ncbi:hypothetical protein EIK76_00485 [Rheinheimera mesophila]|uniref:Phage tail assembly chaperone-like domain-containing protein n=1 Tax=Rheinheimera mesophila TaxID=1547515 RepID=A0A3P3QNW6_9GAMM|nr:phage tail assembly chaperone [Rheinheimera mesophila]KKL00238.1 hypothetical protein SD53_15650 [Rheinheimera mesophila]RRJ22598.1 hypothetical protein EIK76_00485 [Rheinheimera mesophila]